MSPSASPSASLTAVLPAAILDTILGRLALLFLSGAAGDLGIAHNAAAQMLACYEPETVHELRVAANVISFSFHALEALSQASTPEIPLTRILRLRGSAVSLSRESHKAERRLEQLQQARRDSPQLQPEPIDAAQPDAEPVSPRIEKAIALIEATRPSIRTPTPHGAPVWSKPHAQPRPAAAASSARALHSAAVPPHLTTSGPAAHR
jgi:hypothetical protein